MTPEERAVIDAALTWEAEQPAKDHWTDAGLDLAVSALLAARANAEPAGEQAPLTWVERTWRDVRPGDTVRPPGSDTHAVVSSAQLQSWHVDPRGSTYSPVPLEHNIVRVLFVGREGHRDMNPAAPVEIQLNHEIVRVAEMLGWENRVAIR